MAGTLCGGKPQGTFALKEQNCTKCDFYKTVWEEEGKMFRLSGGLLEQLH